MAIVYSGGKQIVHQSIPAISPVLGLPPIIGNAVDEVKKAVQAPLELVIGSALGVISLACQDHINIRRLDESVGPCSLFILTIAESGDRKSAVDRIFAKPISDFEEEKEIEYQKQVSTYTSEIEFWTILQKKLHLEIKKSDQDDIELEKLRVKLYQHNLKKPSHPKREKLIYNNVTPVSLAHGMHVNSSSAALMSDEAGGVLNGHAMNDLAMLNQMWDGSTIKVDRKKISDSFLLKDSRLTISLMTQENSLRKFIERRGKVAMDMGFLPRCLISKPVSLKGQRLLIDSPNETLNSFKNINKFKERLKDILVSKSVDSSKLGSPKKLMELSPEANSLLIQFYNSVEIELNANRLFPDISSAASKIAENAGRMAAIFHFFENRNGDISTKSMQEAITICRGYLYGFNDLFGSYGYFSEESREVDELVVWFKKQISLYKNNMLKNHIRQYGPIRSIGNLDKALDFLRKKDAVSFDFSSQGVTVWLIVSHPLYS